MTPTAAIATTNRILAIRTLSCLDISVLLLESFVDQSFFATIRGVPRSLRFAGLPRRAIGATAETSREDDRFLRPSSALKRDGHPLPRRRIRACGTPAGIYFVLRLSRCVRNPRFAVLHVGRSGGATVRRNAPRSSCAAATQLRRASGSDAFEGRALSRVDLQRRRVEGVRVTAETLSFLHGILGDALQRVSLTGTWKPEPNQT